MIQGFLGRKIGMSQVFREDGRVVPVTVIEAGPCTVTQVKTRENDGYEAVQLGFGQTKKANKPMRGHLRNGQPVRYLKEVMADDPNEFEVGQTISVNIFEEGEKIDIIGRSKGRGFAGTIKTLGVWWRTQDPRSVRPGPRSRLHWRRDHAGQGVQGPQDARPHGQRADHGQALGNYPS